MPATYYEIRLCQNCGLRYPLTEGHPYGVRCPSCLSETEIVLRKQLSGEIHREGDRLPAETRLHVLLDNIRSAWNVGSILRTADGFGFAHAYLCGITPTPEQAEVRKTALGAEEFVTWSFHPNGAVQVQDLHEAGWQILCLEKSKRSTPILGAADWLKRGPTILVLGNEVTGVDPGILDLSDRVVHIPMRGQKRSFNVAVAFAASAAIIYKELIDSPWKSIEENTP